METIWAAVIGVGGTLVLAVIAATWMVAYRMARLQRSVENHSHVLSNGLVAEVKEHGLLLERLQVNQSRLIEDVQKLHQAVERLHEQINRRVAS